MHPMIEYIMQNYNNNFSELHIGNVYTLARVKFYRLSSLKGFDGANGQLRMCNMFMLKQCRNKLSNMAHLFPTDMYKAYPEQLVKILST